MKIIINFPETHSPNLWNRISNIIDKSKEYPDSKLIAYSFSSELTKEEHFYLKRNKSGSLSIWVE